VDADGNFTAEAGQFAGLNVLDDGNQAVIQALRKLGHQGRTIRPQVSIRLRTKADDLSTEQWFAS